jgi:hypothetical protein
MDRVKKVIPGAEKVLSYCFRMSKQDATYAMFGVTAEFRAIGFYISE